jgi:8-oxo-dGTP pyrophosphatase MutT (NUDIX family)
LNWEPQKFFVGLVDFFSILMPGALLAYLGKAWLSFTWLGQWGFPLDSAETWIVFFFASYVLGHFVFLVGSLLDDCLYDPFRKSTYLGQIERLAEGKRLSWALWRALAHSRLIFDKAADAALVQVLRIKAKMLEPVSADRTMNAYQWCRARLSKDHPEGLVEVERFEANSKFFRSFSIVLAGLVVTLAFECRGIATLISFVFFLAALWRYVEQRFKATQRAYWFVLMLETMKSSPPAVGSHLKIFAETLPLSAKGTSGQDRLTHAGGVIYRKGSAVFEYLLVQASTSRSEWVLPKGHIEPGEDPRKTAVREVKEETGYWARVVRWIDDIRFDGDTSKKIRLFLMEAEECSLKSWPAENRQHQWLALPDAIQNASFQETRSLLVKAESLRCGGPQPNKS